MSFVILIILFGGMMWFMQRNQKKAAAQRQEQLDNMQPGSEIVTIGGLHGILANVDKTKGTIELDAEGAEPFSDIHGSGQERNHAPEPL